MTGEIFLTDDELSDSQPVRKALTGLSISSLPKNDQLSDNQPVQKTLDGLSVSPSPKSGQQKVSFSTGTGISL